MKCSRYCGPSILALCFLLTFTGCGTIANLTCISLALEPELHPASTMGGVQFDSYMLNHPEKLGLGGKAAFTFDTVLSGIFDLALLPITLPLAAIVGDGPFAPSKEDGKPIDSEKKDQPPAQKNDNR
jgi:hypothetical protein